MLSYLYFVDKKAEAQGGSLETCAGFEPTQSGPRMQKHCTTLPLWVPPGLPPHTHTHTHTHTHPDALPRPSSAALPLCSKGNGAAQGGALPAPWALAPPTTLPGLMEASVCQRARGTLPERVGTQVPSVHGTQILPWE